MNTVLGKNIVTQPIKIICIILIVLSGCTQADSPKASKLVTTFFRQSLDPGDRAIRFKNYTLEEQYEIFIFGNQVIHPPTIYLDSPFAEQGPVIIPFLKVKLEATKDEATIRDIASVFSEMARLKLYDFSKDTELMKLLNQKVNNMQGMWKDITLKFLAEIKSGKLAR